MHTPRTPRSRTRGLFLVTIALGVVGVAGSVGACGEDGASISTSSARSPRAAPLGSAGDAGAPPLDPEAIHLVGRLVDDLGAPVAGRAILVVDRRARRFETLTDGAGVFRAKAVAPPYDLAIAPAESATVTAPLLYLGLRRPDPRLEIFEREGPTPRLASQPITVGVTLPPCRVEAGACWVSVVTASPSGGGATAGSYTTAESTTFLVEHSWNGARTLPGEVIDVHVLTGDAGYTEYAYARVPNVPARPGEPMDVGMTAPAAVPSSDPITLSAHAPGIAADWQWTLASWLDLPGNATISLRYLWASSTSMRVPRLPGATFRAGLWAQHPPNEDRPYYHRSSQAWTGTLPLTATNVAIDVPAVIETVRPALEGILSRRGVGLAWDAARPALAGLVVVDLARSGHLFRAFTSESEIPPGRLLALGVPRFEQGDHVLDLTTTPDATIDDLTQPDEALRRRRFDEKSPGAATVQRFRFQVTP
ncbi:MAG: hypothetical protein KF819_00970 [Labilithrix sp.]|nr:hypothetical protein [Labilithrix sp.]